MHQNYVILFLKFTILGEISTNVIWRSTVLTETFSVDGAISESGYICLFPKQLIKRPFIILALEVSTVAIVEHLKQQKTSWRRG